MQKKVLDSLFKQGGLTLFAFPGEKTIPLEALQNLALAMNVGARFVIVDFSGENHFEGNAPFTCDALFNGILSKEELDKFAAGQSGWIITGARTLPTSDLHFRNFYQNLQLIKKVVPQVLGILPSEISDDEARRIIPAARLLIVDCDNMECASVYLEDAQSLQGAPLLWLLSSGPSKKRFPRAARAVAKSQSFRKEIRRCDWKKEPEAFCRIVENLHKIGILQKNPLDGVSNVFRKAFPLFLLAAMALPFFFVTKVDPGISNLRDRRHERDKIAVAPSFEYTFDGKESIQRIARYAIGRFNALITNERMIRQYVDVTLEENGYPLNSWEKNNFNIPPEGTILKFSRPDFFHKTASDSIGAAWKYWTSIVSDSVSYLTEFYHASASGSMRQHNGIDLASRQGARILAPFAAKAWTSRDERGGVIIGLVREKDVILFMHCDKLLYLDGQEVMAGDPIATVGTTGHTTGPHAHVVTGIIDKKGTKRIGNVRYNVIDPIQWFYMFKPNSP
ncbi:MAG: peptidoglycan DD-metalloendopeptidase family protein [Fibrobacter sp.]|nr:peptidoglycan DD-metalloendopeptidase family protein [Fibrobacter sp.]